MLNKDQKPKEAEGALTPDIVSGFKGIKKKRSSKKNRVLKRQKYLRMRSRYELKKRLHRKKWIRSGKLRSDGKLFPKRRDRFVAVPAPKDFSVVNNAEEVLSYFKDCSRILNQRNQIIVDLRGIEKLTPDAIALLVAQIKEPRFTRGLVVEGNIPTNVELMKMFVGSGFMDHVFPKVKMPKSDGHNLIHKITNNKVEPEIAKEVCKHALMHTRGVAKIYSPLYEVLIECMANTNNHASLKHEGAYNWWLFEYNDPVTKVTSFTFLDLGVGIFESGSVQRYTRKLARAVSGITAGNIDISPKTNLELLQDLFEGKIYFSRTDDKDRGQGLPLIYDCSKDGSLRNFTIITNDVYVKLPSVVAHRLEHKFKGTLLYWELHPLPIKKQ